MIAAALSFSTVPAAHAAEPALAAPGAPMRMLPVNPPATITNVYGDQVKVPPEAFVQLCSQGPIGTIRTLDGTTQHVMLTASHCINPMPGMPAMDDAVSVNVDGEYQHIGTRGHSNHVPPAALDLSDPVATYNTADWGVVLIDDGVTDTRTAQSRGNGQSHPSEPVVLTSIKDYRTLAPGAISFDNAGQPICKDGSTTGRTCGTQLFRNRDGVFSWDLNYVVGDSGGVNYDPRDNSVIGVSSMVLGPLGKAQAADRIIEEAYGIPDGAVNDHFTLTESTAPHAALPTAAEEFADMGEQIEAMNPDLEQTDPKAELDKAIAGAQQDAQRIVDEALRGNLDVAEAQHTAGYHAGKLTQLGELALQQKLLG